MARSISWSPQVDLQRSDRRSRGGCLPHAPQVVLLQIPPRHARAGRPHVYHHITVPISPTHAMVPEQLANTPSGPVTHNRRPGLPCRRDTKPDRRGRGLEGKHHEIHPPRLHALLVHDAELGSAAEPAEHLRGALGAEPLATLAPTRCDHSPTTRGAHTGTEPVCLLATPIVRLKGSFHSLKPHFSRGDSCTGNHQSTQVAASGQHAVTMAPCPGCVTLDQPLT